MDWDYKSPEQFMPKNWVTFKGEKVHGKLVKPFQVRGVILEMNTLEKSQTNNSYVN